MASENVSRGPTIGQVSPEKTCRVSSWDAVKQIIRRHGVLGLWTGSRLHLARDTIGTGVYFGVYESTKMTITTYRGASQANTGAAIAIAGCLCGILSWCLVSSEPFVKAPQFARN
jgi:Mitochondrial carrier protein